MGGSTCTEAECSCGKELAVAVTVVVIVICAWVAVMLAESNKHLMKIQMRRGESLEKKGSASNLNMDGKGLEERKLKMILRGGGISSDP